MRSLCFVLILLLVYACSEGKKSTSPVVVSSRTIAKAIKESDSMDLRYNVRVILPPKASIKNELMYYHMDSCFILKIVGEPDRFPRLVTPIANGLNNKYEYMVSFGSKPKSKYQFVFHDKYVNGEQLVLHINE